MHKNSKTQTIIAELCEKLHCSELADDLERVNHAREMLAQLQQNEVFKNLQPDKENFDISSNHTVHKLSNILLETKQRLTTAKPSSSSTNTNQSIDGESIHNIEENLQSEEEGEYEMEKSLECEELSNDAWLGFFRGYEILEENCKETCVISENKQCIELCLKDDNSSVENYLRLGIRCFMIDLFIGTELEKQKLIFTLSESELKISREYGFPITTTLFALLSPRLQYTGIIDAKYSTEALEKGNEIILTTKRKYSTMGSCYKVYVNARFLLEDCKEGDYILIGPTLQLTIKEVLEEELKCIVTEPGMLASRLPVRFPARCSRLQISMEELEDITFAREVGINVLVSYKPGTQEYLNNLYDALNLLKCNNLRIFSRLMLNEYQEGDMDLDWIAERYDGFLVDLSIQQDSCCCRTIPTVIPDILKLSSTSKNFINQVYNLKKPIILNPSLIAQNQLFVLAHHRPYIYYYPDKYIFSSATYSNAFQFYLLQNALSEQIRSTELSLQPFCDTSDLGEDTIARACVTASLESQAKAIVVCSAMPDMSIKLSHFRSAAPVILVSATKSLGDYISLYHHIVFMHFRNQGLYTYKEYVANAFIFVMIFLKSRQTLNAGDNVVLVYGSDQSSKLCDKYLVYKFDEKYFANNLEGILFT
ncbi:uncharacterized protein LOC119606855 [Lucilia sericata]|uniref:uncharacterized protein LOC119606855 n=1 Tax=Lucilia sericata TaxID=13632 RepID=UPI0018A82544|nr:uncharacterized protein LOC119606855 [Lucilia sericata]